MNTKPLSSLVVGDLFTLAIGGTVYRVTRPVRVGDGRTLVTYREVDGWPPESYFVRASLTTAHIVD